MRSVDGVQNEAENGLLRNLLTGNPSYLLKDIFNLQKSDYTITSSSAFKPSESTFEIILPFIWLISVLIVFGLAGWLAAVSHRLIVLICGKLKIHDILLPRSHFIHTSLKRH